MNAPETQLVNGFNQEKLVLFYFKRQLEEIEKLFNEKLEVMENK
ncbi:MAG: hypothetical protein WC796_03590 [Candidatus Pacearchaeota archaeon]|jgi:hypothetical protein